MRIILSAFIAGVLTMGIEMVAGRMLVPVLGSSLYQWAGLIGIALSSYILGYFSHEKLFSGSRAKALVLLIPFFYLLIVRAGFASVAPLSLRFDLMFSSIALSAFIVFIPSMIWAAFLPYLQSLPEVQKPARLLAYSALGNLTGVWLISFLLIPHLGTLKSLLILTFLSGILSALWMKNSKSAIATALLILLFGVQYQAASKNQSQYIFRTDSAYQSISVSKDLILSIDGNMQFMYHPGQTLHNHGGPSYFNFATLATERIAKRKNPSVLVLGLGGGLVPTQIKNIYPEVTVDAVEIDEKMISVAKDYFQLSPFVYVINEDARQYLTHSDKKYDYIFLDTYLNSYVPFHLVTQEFVQLISRALKPEGFMIVNLLHAQENTGFLSKFANTIQSEFSHVYTREIENQINTMLIAAKDAQFDHEDFTHYAKNSDDIFTDDLSDSDLLLFRSRRELGVNWAGFEFF